LSADTKWQPVALLPNIEMKNSIEGEGIALAPSHDPRVQGAHSNFLDFGCSGATGQKVGARVLI
jgi:hypothetical protein